MSHHRGTGRIRYRYYRFFLGDLQFFAFSLRDQGTSVNFSTGVLYTFVIL